MDPRVLAGNVPAATASNGTDSSGRPVLLTTGKKLLYCLTPFVVYGLFFVFHYIVSTPILFFGILITAFGIGRFAEGVNERQRQRVLSQAVPRPRLLVTHFGDPGIQRAIVSTPVQIPNPVLAERQAVAKRNNIYTETDANNLSNPVQAASEIKVKLSPTESGDGQNVVLTEVFPNNLLQFTPLVYHQLREYSETGLPIESVTTILENSKEYEQRDNATAESHIIDELIGTDGSSDGPEMEGNRYFSKRGIMFLDSSMSPATAESEILPEPENTDSAKPIAETVYENAETLPEPEVKDSAEPIAETVYENAETLPEPEIKDSAEPIAKTLYEDAETLPEPEVKDSAESIAETLYDNAVAHEDSIGNGFLEKSRSRMDSEFSITGVLIPEIREAENDNPDLPQYSDPNVNYVPSKAGAKPEHVAIPFSAFPERRISSMNPLVLDFNKGTDERFHLAVDHPELFVIKADEQ